MQDTAIKNQLNFIMLNILTYNILSDPLCNPDYFPKNEKDDLEPGTRQARLLNEIKPYLEKKYIFTLQEVSVNQWQWLCVCFEHWDYQHHWFSKGVPFDGYMGIVIAYPREYRLHDVQYNLLNDFLPNNMSKPSKLYPFLTVYLELPNKTRFWLTTTHLPAKPSAGDIRRECLKILSKHLYRCMTDSNCPNLILTGDFNSVPTILLENANPKFKWKSANTTLEYTLSSWNARQEHPVQSLVDWVLINSESTMGIVEGKRIAKPKYIQLLPNKFHSSDHIAVPVSLTIKSKEVK